MAQLFTNNATSVLSSSVSPTASTLTVSSGEGALFPNPQAPDFFLCTLQYNSSFEIVKVTGRSSDTFTIERGQENSTPKSFPAESTVELRVTAGTIESLIYDVLHYRGAYDITSGYLPSEPLVGDMYEVIGTETVNQVPYQSGDFIFWSGQSWIKFKNSAQVNSVNGETGDVNITKDLVGLGSLANQLQLIAVNNLSDVTNTADARTNLDVDKAGTSLRLTMAFL